jgi:SAM-dependent methyltransferase
VSYRVRSCIGCGDSDLEFRPAIVAPFVADRAFRRPATVCRLAKCRACGLGFFEDRFDDGEAARLYASYRDEAYYQARHHWEGWYTRAFNASLGGAAEMTGRRALYRDTIARCTGDAAIDTVLDYGGDRGQLMVGGPGRAHYVYDISGVQPEPGVVSIADSAGLAGEVFDLVLLCEVLEHVSDPARIVGDAAAHVRPGGLLYVTVPNREFPLTDIPQADWYAAYLRVILQSRLLTIAVDFWSTVIKVKLRRVPPLGFVKMHEHINFFDPTALARMLRLVGLNVLVCESFDGGRGLVALCRASA